MDIKHYSYRVIWSEDDQEFVGLCAEFSSLSWLDERQAEALSGIVGLVAKVVADMKKNDETVPKPLSGKKYSGRISFRTTPHIHQGLALAAAEAGVSVNRYINSLVAPA